MKNEAKVDEKRTTHGTDSVEGSVLVGSVPQSNQIIDHVQRSARVKVNSRNSASAPICDQLLEALTVEYIIKIMIRKR